MKRVILCAMATSQLAFGSLILNSAMQVAGTGLGTEPTLLTIQANGNAATEIGCVGSTSSAIGTTFNSAGVCQSGANDVKTGASQIGPQTLASAGVTSASDFAIVFNADQPAGGPITLTGLTAAFYTSTGAFLYETSGFSCTAAGVPGCNFPATSSGIGKSGFLFTLDSAQAAAATAAGVFSTTSTIVGLSASASNVGGGPETFYLAAFSGGGGGGGGGGQTPEPATWTMIGGGLLLVTVGSYRRKGTRS